MSPSIFQLTKQVDGGGGLHTLGFSRSHTQEAERATTPGASPGSSWSDENEVSGLELHVVAWSGQRAGDPSQSLSVLSGSEESTAGGPSAPLGVAISTMAESPLGLRWAVSRFNVLDCCGRLLQVA